MPKITKKVLVKAIVQKTGVKQAEAKRALETILLAMKRMLANGKKLDFGKLGKLTLLKRRPQHRVTKNLKNVCPTVIHLHTQHPKTVRLTKRKDLSENPLPSIVHPPEPPPRRRVRVAVAYPSWRRRRR